MPDFPTHEATLVQHEVLEEEGPLNTFWQDGHLLRAYFDGEAVEQVLPDHCGPAAGSPSKTSKTDSALDDPQLRLVAWSPRGFVPFNPPAAGQRILIKSPSLFWWL